MPSAVASAAWFFLQALDMSRVLAPSLFSVENEGMDPYVVCLQSPQYPYSL